MTAASRRSQHHPCLPSRRFFRSHQEHTTANLPPQTCFALAPFKPTHSATFQPQSTPPSLLCRLSALLPRDPPQPWLPMRQRQMILPVSFTAAETLGDPVAKLCSRAYLRHHLREGRSEHEMDPRIWYVVVAVDSTVYARSTSPVARSSPQNPR